MMNKKIKCILIALLFSFITPLAYAQCEVANTAFRSGENIQYDLYFNYGIVSARAGRGSWSITEANYKGLESYETRMLLNTSGLVGNFYSVNDTLTSYVDMNLRPLLFTKEALEGKDYSRERQIYTYEEDKINIRTIRNRSGNLSFDEVITTEKCTYDYLSVLLYVRNLDYSGMKAGDREYIQFISGKRAVNMYMNYLGKSTIKANNGKTYDVINISLTIYDDAFTNPTDAIKASLTDDAGRIPVVIDTVLKIGSIRAVLKSVSDSDIQ